MKAPWIPDEATVCYELSGCAADKKLGIAVRGSIPVRLLPTPHDVSVKDIFMSGTIEAIIANLDVMETAKPHYFYVTNRYESVKIWINRRSENLNAAVVNPFTDAVVNNTLGLCIAWSMPNFSKTVTPMLQIALSSNMGAAEKFVSSVASAQILALGSGAIAAKTKAASSFAASGVTGFSTVKDLIANITNTRSATKNYDINFTKNKLETPIFRDKTKRKNKVRALLYKAKQIIAPDNLIVRVGSDFNKHHVGTVIDLGIRSISVHDLILFLTYYTETDKLINCFHDNSSENALASKINVI